MNATVAFVLGLLVGWIIEWIIDWIYWRKRTGGLQEENRQLHEQLAGLEKSSQEQQRQLQAQLAEANAAGQEREHQLQAQLDQAEVRNQELERQLALQVSVAAAATHAAAAVEPASETITRLAAPVLEQDDLILINGIGPVIAQKLGQAGIHTFEQLAHLTPDQLRAIVGDSISRLANEDDLIAQAHHFAAQKRGRG